MSFPAMSWAVRQKLPCTQKIVLLMLAERHNKDSGQCNPSHDRLADDCGLTRRSVMEQIAKLEGAGYLRIRHRSSNNVKLPNQYVLVFSFGVQEEIKDFEEVVNDVHHPVVNKVQGVVNHVPLVVNVVHQGSEPRSHKPVIEPVIEPKEKKKSAAAPTIPDVPDEVLADFLKIRKAKNAPLTNTAIAGIRREAGKAGITMTDALIVCCEAGWQGFRADWYAKRTQPAVIAPQRQAESFAERDARAKREAWEAMTNRKWPEQDLPANARGLVIDAEPNNIRRIA